MVVNMMKRKLWPSRRLEVKLVVQSLQGISCCSEVDAEKVFMVAIQWKGTKSIIGLGKKRRDFTKEVSGDGQQSFQFNQEFINLCNFSFQKDGGLFLPWVVSFTVFTRRPNGISGNKSAAVGTASLNLAYFASSQLNGKDLEINLQLTVPPRRALHNDAKLSLCLGLSELKSSVQDLSLELPIESVLPQSPCSSFNKMTYLKNGKMLRVDIEEDGSDNTIGVSFDTSDSLNEDFDTSETDKEDIDDANVFLSFGYGKLSPAKSSGVLSNVYVVKNPVEHMDLTFNRNRTSGEEALDVTIQKSCKRGILSSWRKRKLSFRSPKATKGEPLLKKYYGEDGGDDIDFDRRQLSSSEDDDSIGQSTPKFGDDIDFAIGKWDNKEITSRDGHMKLQACVFFASIDQRSERASGEGACASLVALVADWFLRCDENEMPIKSEIDTLIREGSLEWRSMCENEAYRDRFLDKHFDLETVLEAEIRPIAIVPDKSFIGFFIPEDSLDFLEGAMSFDSIWHEIDQRDEDDHPRVYVVSWNDHFFVLKVVKDAYYIVDTLGERLYEGCNEAYILKFDDHTTIQYCKHVTKEVKSRKGLKHNAKENEVFSESTLLCRGKDCCKEYIKSFLAAISVREAQAEIVKKGLSNASVHRRLQIEFHCMESLIL